MPPFFQSSLLLLPLCCLGICHIAATLQITPASIQLWQNYLLDGQTKSYKGKGGGTYNGLRGVGEWGGGNVIRGSCEIMYNDYKGAPLFITIPWPRAQE